MPGESMRPGFRGPPEWRHFADYRHLIGDPAPLRIEIARDSLAKSRISDPVGGAGKDRLIAAGDLVLALRAGLHPGESALDREFDRLMVADLEMQERAILDPSPIAPIERVAADEVERAGDRASVGFSDDHHDFRRHRFGDLREERARQIGPPPFSPAGLLVEFPKRIPIALAEFAAGKASNGHPLASLPPFALQRLALARGGAGPEPA